MVWDSILLDNCFTLISLNLLVFSFPCHRFRFILLIAQALKPLVRRAGFWGSVKTLARGYEIVGLLTPVAFLAWFPFFFQNFRPVCCSTKHSVEVCKFPVFLEVKGRGALLAIRNNLSTFP